MNKLQEQMLKEIIKSPAWVRINDSEANDLSVAAAKVAMKWIEKAFDAGGDRSTFHGRPGMEDAPTKEEWLKENGLTPTEPETHGRPSGWTSHSETSTVIGSNGITDPPNETKKV